MTEQERKELDFELDCFKTLLLKFREPKSNNSDWEKCIDQRDIIFEKLTNMINHLT